MREAMKLAIWAIVLATAATSHAALRGSWTFDGHANDVSGNGLNGSLIGDAAYSSDVSSQIGTGQSLQLDGAGDYFDSVMPTFSVTGSYTVSAWVNPSSAAGGNFFSTRQPSDQSFDAKLINGNRIHGDIGSGSNWLTTGADYVFPSGYDASTWYHIAYVVNPGSYEIYVNGSRVMNNGMSAGTPLLLDSNHNVRIGTYQNEHFNGNIDNVAVWDQALSGTAVNHLAEGVQAADVHNVNLRLTVDNGYEVYLSTADDELGQLLGSDGRWQDHEDFNVQVLEGHTYYMHVVASNTEGAAAFIAEMTTDGMFLETGSDTIVTDGDWNVNDTGFGDAYELATEMGAFGRSPWTADGLGPFGDAQWIWDASPADGEVLYFSRAFTVGPGAAIPEPAAGVMLLLTGIAVARRRRSAA